MPLPKLELKPGVTESLVRGKGHDDIRVLFRDLHEGVLELGVGNCEVLAYKRVPMEFGFDLCNTDEANHYRVWGFMITLDDFKRTAEPLDAAIREAMTHIQGRARIARMLQVGMSVQDIGKRLVDPAVVYIRAKMKELQAKADKAQAEAQAEMHGDKPAPRRGPFGLGAQPATTHFLLQQQIGALEHLVGDLELGKHLP